MSVLKVWRAPLRVTGVGAGLALSVWLWRSIRRVEVVGHSMAPALRPGDRLLVLAPALFRPGWPAPGTVVAVRDPRDPDRILVKRVTVLHRAEGTLEIEGDAAEASTDSRTFGPVPRSSLIGRAVYRYAPTARIGAGPWPGEYHRA
jgi:nickel-type superoxide dismutase maturation protease